MNAKEHSTTPQDPQGVRNKFHTRATRPLKGMHAHVAQARLLGRQAKLEWLSGRERETLNLALDSLTRIDRSLALLSGTEAQL